MATSLRAISRVTNVNKTQCATCWLIYALDQTFVSSPYRVAKNQNESADDFEKRRSQARIRAQAKKELEKEQETNKEIQKARGRKVLFIHPCYSNYRIV